MSQIVVALVGVSGVGKTTFLHQLAQTLSFQHLTAGSLIAEARSQSAASRDDLRLSNLDENQSLLVRGFECALNPRARLVVLDGHVVIHNESGLHSVGSIVFSKLGIKLIGHLEADPARVHLNRASDVGRNRPIISIEKISDHQAKSRSEALKVAADLGIDFVSIMLSDAESVERFRSQLEHLTT